MTYFFWSTYQGSRSGQSRKSEDFGQNTKNCQKSSVLGFVNRETAQNNHNKILYMILGYKNHPIIIPRKLLPNTEKLFRYSVKMYWLYRKTFLFRYQYRMTFIFGIQYRKTFSVIYADTANRKRVYTHDEGCPLSITEKLFRLMYYVFIDAI